MSNSKNASSFWGDLLSNRFHFVTIMSSSIGFCLGATYCLNPSEEMQVFISYTLVGIIVLNAALCTIPSRTDYERFISPIAAFSVTSALISIISNVSGETESMGILLVLAGSLTISFSSIGLLIGVVLEGFQTGQLEVPPREHWLSWLAIGCIIFLASSHFLIALEELGV